jgi:7,8-dihydroneopterin aldolase/epimerase/oxygenase
MDFIFIREFRCEARVGVYDWEQLRPQPLEFDIEVGLPTTVAGHSDRLDDTIDYGSVVNLVRERLADRRFQLLEALAEHIAERILSGFGAPWTRVSIAKIHHVTGVKRMGVSLLRQATRAAPELKP